MSDEMEVEQVRPRVLISRCLGFAACRYDGRNLGAGPLVELFEQLELVPLCPELEMGLGVPRPPIDLVVTPEGVRLVRPSDRADLTGEARRAWRRVIDRLGPLDGAILTARSPSCGVVDAPRYAAIDGPALARGAGLFTQLLLARDPDLPCADQRSLADSTTRRAFLARVGQRARGRWHGRPNRSGPAAAGGRLGGEQPEQQRDE